MTLKSARLIVLARAAGRCECCGARSSRLEMSHRVARGMGGTKRSGDTAHSPANLCALTSACHRRVEANPEWAYRTGLKVRRGQDPLAVPVWMWHGRKLLTDDGRLLPVED